MANTAKFKQLAPRMMRDLMRDFAPLADFHAASVVGNGGGESGGFTIAQEVHPISGRGGLGFFQDTGPRRVSFEKWIRDHGGDPSRDALNYDYNYGFLKHELQTSERATIPALRKTKSLAEATASFMRTFERPGILNTSGRIGWAKMALDAYKAEQAQITKNPPIVAEMHAPAAEPAVSIVRKDAPVDGQPKPKENNTGFWATMLGSGAVASGAVWKYSLDWLPAVVGIGGLILLAIFMLRPVYVRWRDYLRHSPEYIELAHGSPWKALGVLFQGWKTTIVTRALQGVSALLVLFQTASGLVGADSATGISLDNVLPAVTLPIGAEGVKVMASQWVFIGTYALSWLASKFRSMSTTAVGQLDPVTAVEMSTNAQSTQGSVPSPALAAVTDPAAVADLVQTPIPAPHGIDSSTLLGEKSVAVAPKKSRSRKKAKRKAKRKGRR